MLTRAVLALLGFLAMASPALAQSQTQTMPWNPVGPSVSLSASGSSSNVQLGWVGLQSSAPVAAYVCNTGTADAFVNFGATNAVTAATTNFKISANASGGLPNCILMALNGASFIAGITGGSGTTLTISTGNGSPVGGLGTGTGGSGAVLPGTAGQVAYYAGTGSAVSGENNVTAAQMLPLTSAHLYVGNGSNVPADVAVSGDLTLANTGAFTVAALGGNTLTTAAGSVQLNSAGFGLSGNFSAADWGTAGIRYKNVAATITNTTSSGTIATEYTDVFGGNTIAANSATTFSAYFAMYVKAPIAGANVTMTNKYALGADTFQIGTNGSAVSPSLQFPNGQGFYQQGNNSTIAISTGSSWKASFDSTVNTALDVLGSAGYGFATAANANPDLEMCRQAAGVLEIGTTACNALGGIQAATLALGGASIGSNALAVTGSGAFSSAVTITGGAPTQAAGTLGLFGGNGSTPSLGANGEGDAWTNTAFGLMLIGQGSSDDVAILNKSGSTVMVVPTGTQTAAFSGQIQAQSMTQSAAAQSGTVCQNTGGTLTYDATVGCLTSDERLKVILGYGIPNAADELMALRPMVYDWSQDAPRFANDPGDHLGMGAFATAYIDERLIARGGDGQPRGWRLDAMLALAVAGFQDHEARLRRLEAR